MDGVDLEILMLDFRAVPAPVEHDEPVALRQWPLLEPPRLPVGHAPVHEQHGLSALSPALRVQVHLRSFLPQVRSDTGVIGHIMRGPAHFVFPPHASPDVQPREGSRRPR